MKNKIFITILLLITLTSCGFSPIYMGSSKQVVISKSEIVGDKDLAFNLEQKLNFRKIFYSKKQLFLLYKSRLIHGTLRYTL